MSNITLGNTLRHLRLVHNHRKLVRKHCFKLGLYYQGLTHDLSKYSFTELIPSIIHFQGHRSPNEQDRKINGYSKAWLHHKGRNKHHFEYWMDYSNDRTKVLSGVKMPLKYVAEMFCDRISASKTYLGDNYKDSSTYEYMCKSRSAVLMHDDTNELLKELTIMLMENGEEYTFHHLKLLLKEGKY